MEDNVTESDSNSSTEPDDIESELYSVLHYNDFSKEVPPEILDKYNIRREGDNFFISLKGKSLHELKSDICLPLEECPGNVDNLVDEANSSSEINVTPSTSLDPSVMENIASTPISKGSHTSIFDKNENSPRSVSPISVQAGVSVSLESDVIVLSDSDNSDVIIQEPVIETTYISSSSSVESLHDIEDMADLILNTSRNQVTIFPKDDTVEEEIKFKWRDVASPRVWSKSMRKYYNKPSETLKNFDHLKILEEIKDKGTWHILPQDLFPKVGPVKRCSLCRQTDHLVKSCPKRFSNCAMCGNPGHPAPRCPYRMCLNCGRQNTIFVAMCNYCEATRYKVCNECNQVGHLRNNCPDTWRKFHSTTSGEYTERPNTVNEKLMCCNCGKKGHLFEDCETLYWSIYPPTSFLVQNKNEPQSKPGKHKDMNEFQNRRRNTMPEFEFNKKKRMHEFDNDKRKTRNNKKPRWNSPQFNKQRYFNSNPQTPESSKKKRKKKTKSPNFKNQRHFNNINFTF